MIFGDQLISVAFCGKSKGQRGYFFICKNFMFCFFFSRTTIPKKIKKKKRRRIKIRNVYEVGGGKDEDEGKPLS